MALETTGVWTPRVTVAAVIERNQHYLMVQERDADGQRVWNQPAGHLEAGESLIEACRREVREETAHDFQAEKLLGIYQWQPSPTRPQFLRVAFLGQALALPGPPSLDPDILQAAWLSWDDILDYEAQNQLRSPLVMQTLKDARRGQHAPLTLLQALGI